MARAAKICAHVAGCGNLQPCSKHRVKPWANSKRKSLVAETPAQQAASAARIIRRYRGKCHWCGEGGATVVDHVQPLWAGGDDNDSNKRPIHASPCHVEKTSAEAAQARKMAQQLATLDPIG